MDPTRGIKLICTYAESFWGNMKIYLYFRLFLENSDGTHGWNPFSGKVREHLSYIVITMAADGLAMYTVWWSAALVLSLFTWIISRVSCQKGPICHT